jgi:hypothetical protein
MGVARGLEVVSELVHERRAQVGCGSRNAENHGAFGGVVGGAVGELPRVTEGDRRDARAPGGERIQEQVPGVERERANVVRNVVRDDEHRTDGIASGARRAPNERGGRAQREDERDGATHEPNHTDEASVA